jgi:hypothetical protein
MNCEVQTKFMLTKENMDLINNLSSEFMFPVVLDKVVFNTREIVKTPLILYLNPLEEDSLFWCVFIKKFGNEKYNMIFSKYKNLEIEEKMKVVEFIKNDMNCMKHWKISKVKSQCIMGDLMTNSKTNLLTLNALAMYYKMNILIVNMNKETYIEYGNADEMKYVIYKNKTKKEKYYVILDDDKENNANSEQKIVNNYYRYESYDKPMRAISSYKVKDLEKLAEKHKMEIPVGIKKVELYKNFYSKIMEV